MTTVPKFATMTAMTKDKGEKSPEQKEREAEKSRQDDLQAREEELFRREQELDMIAQERELAFSGEEKAILKWMSAARPFKKRGREYFTTIGAIVILLAIILFFAREFLLIGVMFALTFVAYVFASVPPEKVTHEITNRGIWTGGKFFRWDILGRFWFHEKFGQKMVSVETFLTFPRHVVLLLGDKKEEELKEVLQKFVLLEKPEPGFLDKASDWLSEKIPLEE